MSVTIKHLHDAIVTQIEFTQDFICLSFDDGKIQVFDKDGDDRWTLDGHEGGVWALSSWGNTLVSGSTDKSAKVWDLDTG